ncbi:MAG: hypothetical protein R3F43_02555 [bacterium]
MIRVLRYLLAWLFVPLLLTRWAIARLGRKSTILLVNLEGMHPHRPTGSLLARGRRTWRAGPCGARCARPHATGGSSGCRCGSARWRVATRRSSSCARRWSRAAPPG